MESMDLLLKNVPADRRVALLMRHSVRYEITTQAEIFTAGLTPEGIALARQLGSALASKRKIGRILSSPVGRCVDTALAMAHTARWKEKVHIENRLSHPHIAPVWDVLPMCYGKDPFPGPLHALVDLVFDRPEIPGVLDLLVTHDTVVGSLTAYLFCENYSNGDWPNYLEGAFLWQDQDEIQVYWRGRIRTMPRAAATGKAAYQYYLGV
jgi:hypothetical protein